MAVEKSIQVILVKSAILSEFFATENKNLNFLNFQLKLSELCKEINCEKMVLKVRI
jgi:hypothetical protein